jgi:hypothetical protein
MSSISIIGAGTMARVPDTRALPPWNGTSPALDDDRAALRV